MKIGIQVRSIIQHHERSWRIQRINTFLRPKPGKDFLSPGEFGFRRPAIGFLVKQDGSGCNDLA